MALSSVILLNLPCAQYVLANFSASQEGLLVRCKQDGSDRIICEGTNVSNQSVHFSIKITYVYRTLTGTEHTDSKVIDCSLGANQFATEIGTVTEPHIQVQSVAILYATYL